MLPPYTKGRADIHSCIHPSIHPIRRTTHFKEEHLSEMRLRFLSFLYHLLAFSSVRQMASKPLESRVAPFSLTSTVQPGSIYAHHIGLVGRFRPENCSSTMSGNLAFPPKVAPTCHDSANGAAIPGQNMAAGAAEHPRRRAT